MIQGQERPRDAPTPGVMATGNEVLMHHERTCRVCHTPHTKRGIYCSRKCCRRVSNAKARGSEVRAPIHSFECEQCGTTCVPGENVAAHASRFCGEPCKKRWHRDRETYHSALPQWPPSVGPHDYARYKRVLRADPCAYCGTTPSGLDHIEPKSESGVDDWTNYTGCCKRCNGAKGTLSLLAALLWLPASRQYHDLRKTLWHAAA